MKQVLNLKPGWTKEKFLERIKKYNPGRRVSFGEICKYSLKEYANIDERCFIGCFIPDGHEGLKYSGSVTHLIERFPDLNEIMPLINLQELQILQNYHDKESNWWGVLTQNDMIKYLETRFEIVESPYIELPIKIDLTHNETV